MIVMFLKVGIMVFSNIPPSKPVLDKYVGKEIQNTRLRKGAWPP